LWYNPGACILPAIILTGLPDSFTQDNGQGLDHAIIVQNSLFGKWCLRQQSLEKGELSSHSIVYSGGKVEGKCERGGK